MSFELGKWLVICDRCGFQRKNDQVQKTWDGHMVCRPEVKIGCYETRHPLEFIRNKPDNQSVPYVRPAPTETFVSGTSYDTSVGVQETTIPAGTFTTNNSTLED